MNKAHFESMFAWQLYFADNDDSILTQMYTHTHTHVSTSKKMESKGKRGKKCHETKTPTRIVQLDLVLFYLILRLRFFDFISNMVKENTH